MPDLTILLALLQLLPIIGIYIRIESRLSRLEGRFDMFIEKISNQKGGEKNG